MKYELLGTYKGNIITTILNNRGIFDVGKILRPTRENDTDIFSIQNINEGVELVKNNIGKRILIEVDSDVDGFTSGAIMYKMLKAINPLADVVYYIHEGKKHGITREFLEFVNQKEPDLVIIPDAATNDVNGREEIVKKGIDLLIIDHHQAEKSEVYDSGTIINNQLDGTNKNLTGAGMTYLFCKALEEKFQTNVVESFRDLAMLGLLGDSASLIDNEVRNLCYEGLENINSNLIKTSYGDKPIENITFKDLSWGGVIPSINAVVRVGDLNEKTIVFKALADIDTDYFEMVSKRKLNKETRHYENIDIKMNIYELALEAGNKCKNKQNAIVKAEMKNSDSQFNPETGVQIYVTKNENAKDLTGLLANKLKSQWEQPTLVIWYDEKHKKYNGSMRGYEKTMSDFKSWCLSTGKFNFVQGHPNAAGLSINVDKLDEFIECCKNIESEEIVHKVDMAYEGNANVDHIFEVHNNKKIFGNGIEEPLFAINNLKVPKNSLRWSKKTMRISLDYVTYVVFGIEEEEFKTIKNSGGSSESVTFNVIGKFDVNEWNSRKYPQVVVSDWEIKRERPSSFLNKPNPLIAMAASVDYGMFA